jgi:hypothetical protein
MNITSQFFNCREYIKNMKNIQTAFHSNSAGQVNNMTCSYKKEKILL